ncbi:hypothetical protein KI688_011945 [Linnemannia hyalina]|uniref:Transcription factor Iwr1 domain-containing protein n=1 Tax=Linnemannia hyalina TaxID=64524 RepID=A0A9P8BSI6_9FUNG|nr:hypothetical protein KI688_011945 [Linnemannia hyalina]
MGKNTVAKRRCLDEGVVSPPSSVSLEPSSSSSSSSSTPSPSSSPSPTYKIISSPVTRATTLSLAYDFVLADFDACDLKTPVYSTAQTPGTAIRMLNNVALGGGSLVSPVSPACSIDLEPFRMLSNYKGYKKALYHISEMATFEEDMEYVKHNEPLDKFLARMEKRAACETDPEDEDINSGPAFAATRAVAYPESESEDEHSVRNRGDLASKVFVTTIAAAKYHKQRQDYEDGNTTPKAFAMMTRDDDNRDWGFYSDSCQETVRGYGSGDDEDEQDLDYDHEDSFGRNYKAADSANDLGHSYEDEDGDHEDGYADHRNDDKDSFEHYDEVADGAHASGLHYEDELIDSTNLQVSAWPHWNRQPDL